jgi:hypothetical protein
MKLHTRTQSIEFRSRAIMSSKVRRGRRMGTGPYRPAMRVSLPLTRLDGIRWRLCKAIYRHRSLWKNDSSDVVGPSTIEEVSSMTMLRSGTKIGILVQPHEVALSEGGHLIGRGPSRRY